MFGISSAELLFVLLIAFLIVGPKKMARIAYDVGRWLGKVKSQLKYIKETQFDVFDDSPYYSPKVEMNKSLEEINKENSKSQNPSKFQ